MGRILSARRSLVHIPGRGYIHRMAKEAGEKTGMAGPAAFDYNRTVVGYHGTTRDAADTMVNGSPIAPSTNDDDWLGHGVYFWEHAPKQAWWWAQRRYGKRAAVVGAMIRLGRCLDLLDPSNVDLLTEARQALGSELRKAGLAVPANHNTHKFLDCVVFNHLYKTMDSAGHRFETCRAVFVPMQGGRMPRLWTRSGVFRGGHIQISIREPANIVALWHVREDGRYGKEGT